METRIKHFSNVEHLKMFRDYGVDTEGNVWSFKNNKSKKLSPGWKKKGCGYKSVILTDINKQKKSFLIHRLVAISFIPTKDISLEVNHKNKDSSDNRLENLEWVNRNENTKETSGFIIDDFIMNKLKNVHSASIRKGLPVPDTHSFFNSMIEGALENYINQYGLRKVMNH